MRVLPIYNNGVNYRGNLRHVTKVAQETTQTVKGNSLLIAGKEYKGETTFELVKNYTLDKFHSISLKQDKFDIRNITPETRYYQDIGADSIDMATMVAELEYATGYRVSEDVEVDKFIKIQDLVDFIDSHRKIQK